MSLVLDAFAGSWDTTSMTVSHQQLFHETDLRLITSIVHQHQLQLYGNVACCPILVFLIFKNVFKMCKANVIKVGSNTTRVNFFMVFLFNEISYSLVISQDFLEFSLSYNLTLLLQTCGGLAQLNACCSYGEYLLISWATIRLVSQLVSRKIHILKHSYVEV